MALRSRRSPGRFVAIMFLGLLPLTMVAPGHADEISDKQNQRQQTGGLIASLQQQIAATQNQEVQLQALIASLNAQIAATQGKIDDQQARLDAIARQLDADRAHLAATKAKLAADKATLGNQLKVIYEANAQSTPLNNLIGSQNFNDFWVKLLNTQRIAAQEQKLVDKVKGEELQAETEVAAIAVKEAEQQGVVDQLLGQRATLAAQQAAQQQAQRQLAAVIAQDRARLAQAEAAAKALDNEIAGLIAAQAAAAAAAAANHSGGGNGHFVWPMSGGISQYFGCSPYFYEPWDPSCPSRHIHTGLDIADSCGTPVRAADAGIAYTYYSNWGYGQHVIIIHGNGWSTVYGHLGNISVGNGQGVGRGQTIGNEGSTGNSTGCHLHFEVRSGGNPVNPMNYLP